jgi:Rrf2 family protein
MNLSKRGEYALRALIKLGIARELGRELISASELAETERLPLKFVEQIMFQLREAGYIDTKRGKFGGYFLKRPAKEIRIGEVIRLIDGKIAPISCASPTCYERCSCPDEAHCGLRMMMIDVRNAISNIVDRYSIADVVSVTIRKIQQDNLPLPFEKRPEPATAAAAGTEPRAETRNPADPLEGFLAALS